MRLEGRNLREWLDADFAVWLTAIAIGCIIAILATSQVVRGLLDEPTTSPDRISDSSITQTDGDSLP